MAATVHYFMLPEDEASLFRMLARRELTLWPDLIPPGHVPIRVDAGGVGELLILATRIAKSYGALLERVR